MTSQPGDDLRKELKRAGAAGVAAAAAVALLAGLTTPSAAQTVRTADPFAAAAPTTAAAGKGLTRITLVTGDRVVVDAKGRAVGLERAPGRARIPVSVQHDRGHTSVVPADARRLIADGTLDARLFDITERSRPEYRAAHGDRLRLIVGYRGAAPAARAALHSAGDTEVRRTFTSIGAEALSAAPRDAAEVWEALTDRGGAGSRTAAAGIARIWLDGIRTASLDKSTRQIGADKAWAAGYDGKGVKIAVLDTGVDAAHADLAGQVLAEKNFSSSADAKDRFGHGTHVASIAAGTGAASGGTYKGVAPGAKLLNAKVLDDNGSGDDSGILAGMEWAVAQGADVVNLSLGGGDTPELDPLEAAVNRLSADKGVLFAIAAGNNGQGGPGTVSSPGSADAALTVGAVNVADKLAPFSSIGPRVGDGAIKPDVTAPGVAITAAAAPGSVIEREVGQKPPGYLTISGTSMATPHVAGAAALLKQQHPQWKGDRLKGVLTASTKPGAYSAFQQGSGRIAVDRAIRQSVVAEPVSLSYGVQQWPHQDDKPVTKDLTYRNLGSAPVTLDLAVATTGPDGKPAPAGFFTLGARKVTVPAGGTATVALTADTRGDDNRDGAYSAYVTATGGGQSVRTAAAVDRESESYDVTVKQIGRDGKPAAYSGSTLIGLSGPASQRRFEGSDASGTFTLRVPRGGYLLDAIFINNLEDIRAGVDWIAQPRLTVRGNTTLTVDARTARPVDITVPAAGAKSLFASPSYWVRSGANEFGFGWWLDSYEGFRTGHRGPDADFGTLTQQFDAHWQKGASDEYHAVLGGPVRRLANGYTKHLRAADLATVTVDQGVAAAGKEGALNALGWLPAPTGASSVSIPRPLPTTATMHLSTLAGVRWDTRFEQSAGRDADGFPIVEAQYGTDSPKAYQGGKSYRERFNTGVFGPKVGSGLGVLRHRNTITGLLPLFADGSNHSGASNYTKAETVLYRNGVPVGRSSTPPQGEDSFTVPAGDAAYKLTAKVDRSPLLSMVSTRVQASWWFRSQKTAKAEQLPVSVVRFRPELALDNTSPAGRTVTVPLTVQGPAKGSGLKSLAAYVSYDDGYTWKALTVTDGRVSVKNPAKGKRVSLRAVVVDRGGNKADLSIIGAYCTG
ncbi:S8 family peptidase [Streptomyces sp. NBC_00239]|uniref:S8 family peptidase n=1 Tax=Streptomyces sp. NBC_00239 TaxID=2903640 RepID=UPI002E2D52F1|nr:S8 family serine peptidase [Streptomyces sp. NBC_00239]